MIRKINKVGRITIPSEIRERLDINEEDLLEIYINDDEIILIKVEEENE